MGWGVFVKLILYILLLVLFYSGRGKLPLMVKVIGVYDVQGVAEGTEST